MEDDVVGEIANDETDLAVEAEVVVAAIFVRHEEGGRGRGNGATF